MPLPSIEADAHSTVDFLTGRVDTSGVRQGRIRHWTSLPLPDVLKLGRGPEEEGCAGQLPTALKTTSVIQVRLT